MQLPVKGREDAARPVASTRRLFLVYAAVSLVPVLALGSILVGLTHRQADSRGLAQGRSEAALISKSLVAPLLNGTAGIDQGLTDGQRTGLNETVSVAVADQQILRLRIRNLHGVAVWSSDGNVSPKPDDESLEAARGEPVSSLTFLNADPDAGDGQAPGSDATAKSDENSAQRGPRVVEVYTPIVAPNSDRRIGVLEVYLPYAPIAADVTRGTRQLTIALTLGLLVLWMALLGVSVSVTRRLRRSAQKNAFLAEHDTLTGLPNRSSFAHVSEAAVLAATKLRPTAIAVIDLDRFKQVNDTLGHVNGDQLLVQVADRLQSRLRDADTVARLGGDEFGIVLPGVHGPSEAVEVLQRLRSALAEPLTLDGLPLAIEASIGFALAPDDGTDMDTLMTRADVAMYVAKRQHLGVVHYQKDHDHFDAAALGLIAELGHAIEHDQLVLHYQPKADLRAGGVSAVEALVRWNHPSRGLLYPDAFLPAAEQTELVEPLTCWVLREALRTLPSLDTTGRLAVAVNISARSLTRLDFADDVLAILAETDMPASRVILEITETALIADPRRAAETLGRLHEAGIRVSIDDFGAGQTSLGYLATLPITELKIDKAFVLAMTEDSRNAAIVRSVIQLGHSLGFTVTAEGVETQEMLSDLAAAHCDLVQGYFLGRPMEAGKVREHLVGLADFLVESTPA